MTLNEMYDQYHLTKSDHSYAALFKGLRQLAKSLCSQVLAKEDGLNLDEACEDAATHCALQVWEGKYHPKAKFETWARSVIRHKLIDWVRQNRDENIAGSLDDPDMFDVIPTMPDPLVTMLKREALNSLTELERKVLSLKLNHLSNGDIETELQISGSKLDRIIRKLKSKNTI